MKKRILATTSVSLLLLSSTGMTSVNADDNADITIDELIETAYEKEEELTSFYQESETSVTVNDEETSLLVKEWVKIVDDNTLTRIEIHYEDDDNPEYIVGDDYKVTYYKEGDTFAVEYERNLSEEDETIDDDTAVTFDDLDNFTLASLLDENKENFDITINGTEEVMDREAYHLTFDPIEGEADTANSFDLWIDKEYFVMLRQLETGDGYEYLIEITEFEPNIEIEDEIFELEIPEGVEIRTYDDVDEEFSDDEEITDEPDGSDEGIETDVDSSADDDEEEDDE